MKILVKFSKDWADEFECEEFDIVEAESIDALKAHIESSLSEDSGFDFGTNEGWEAGDLYIDSFTFTELSDKEADTFQKFFEVPFGTGILRNVL